MFYIFQTILYYPRQYELISIILIIIIIIVVINKKE